MKCILIIILCLFLTKLNAQTESGYLLRCYASETARDTVDYYLSSMFIDSTDFKKQEFESYLISYPEYHFHIEEKLARLFCNMLSYIVTVVRRKDISDTSCTVSKPVNLSDVSRQRSLKCIVKVDKGLSYKFYIDKVGLAYCKMVYSDPDNYFKKMISLQKTPVLQELSSWEREKFLAAFENFKIISRNKK